MNGARATVNDRTHSVGIDQRLVTVSDIPPGQNLAICVDRKGIEVRVPLYYQRAKGALPQAGETWLLSQDTGQWMFSLLIGTAGNFPLQIRSTSPRVLISSSAGALPLTGAMAEIQGSLALAPSLGNIREWYAPAGNGNDDAAPVNAALRAGYRVDLIDGAAYMLRSTIQLKVSGNTIRAGANTILQAAPGFVPDASGMMVSITAGSCEVDDMQLAGLGTAASVQCGGIGIYESEHVRIGRVTATLMSYYAYESVGGAATANLDQMLSRLIARNCAAGLHLAGVSGSSFHAEAFLHDIQIQQCGASDGFGKNMHGMLIENCEDFLLAQPNIGMVAGSGADCCIQGSCATLRLLSPDFGSGVNAMLIQDDDDGNSPEDIKIIGGIFQQASADCLVVTGGAKLIRCSETRFTGAAGNGANFSGSGSGNGLTACDFTDNNKSGGTNYELQSSQGTQLTVRDSIFQTPFGSGSGQVSSVINDMTHQLVIEGCNFGGSGFTPSAIFASGGTPRIVRHCTGYNPRGSITAPAITAGTFTTTTSQDDVTIYFGSLGGMTAFKVSGFNISSGSGPPVLGVGYRVPARTPIEIDSSGTPPTWHWVAD